MTFFSLLISIIAVILVFLAIASALYGAKNDKP